jgi:hypothetical protein
MTQASTTVGAWRVAKIRVDNDPWLASRWSAGVQRDGSQDRNVKAIRSRLNSSNTIFKE